MRASDEDRERLIAELNEHTVAGRLGTDELEDRVQAVYAARTTAELDALRRDLPVSQRQLAIDHAQRRSHLARRMIQEAGGSVIAFAVATGVWAATGAGFFWPVFVLIAVLITLGRTTWALYGPAADLDAAERHLDRQADRSIDRRDRHNRHRQARLDRRDSRRNRRPGP